METTKEHRGDRKSSVTEDMLKDIDNAVRNQRHMNRRYHRNRWGPRVLQQ